MPELIGHPLQGGVAPPGSRTPDASDVFNDHFDFAWRTLRALGVQHDAIDDAVQDVFLIVHRRLPEFQRRSSLRTWLFSIVHNVALNYRRRHRRKGGTEPLGEDIDSQAPSPLERAQDHQAAAFVGRFLEQLDDAKRVVFVLIVLEELSAPEVAEALCVPIGTVYSRLRVAREKFREQLAEHLPGDAVVQRDPPCAEGGRR